MPMACLDCPHYTRPEQSDLGNVPEVLLAGIMRNQTLADEAVIRQNLVEAAGLAGKNN